MNIEKFKNSPVGTLVPIFGTDPRFGEWRHWAFSPFDLPETPILLRPETQLQVTNARVALASLNRAARQLPNPHLLRGPTLRREAQSTSALEGTYATLEEVMTSDEKSEPLNGNLKEVMNYVKSANYAFSSLAEGRTLTLDLLEDLQNRLIRGTHADNSQGGKVRDIQVFIGSHQGSRISDARFVPRPPDIDLPIQVRSLLSWMQSENRSNIDPIVAAAMAHYQFETLHPFNDGNGRIGRLLIVLHLMTMNVINEPMLSVSEWFESRRAEYFDSLLEVSATGNWDGWINFFSRGIEYSARAADSRLTDLLAARKNLRDKIDKSKLTSISAMKLVDFALGNIIFNAKNVQEHLELTYPRANSLINQLVELGILKELGRSGRTKHYMAPDVYSIYTG